MLLRDAIRGFSCQHGGECLFYLRDPNDAAKVIFEIIDRIETHLKPWSDHYLGWVIPIDPKYHMTGQERVDYD